MDILKEVIDQRTEFNADLDWFIADYQKVKKLMIQREAEIARLRAKVGDDGSASAMEYTFAELERRAKGALNMNHGWQTKFETQSGYTHSAVEKWKVIGLVPEGAILSCKGLEPATKASRISWKKNPDLVEHVETLYNAELTYTEIASRMAVEFPAYEWNDNVVAGAVNNHGIKARKDARDAKAAVAY